VRRSCYFLLLILFGWFIVPGLTLHGQSVAEGGQARVPTLNVDTKAVVLEVVVTKDGDEPVRGFIRAIFR
jgi:hypothetical protein